MEIRLCGFRFLARWAIRGYALTLAALLAVAAAQATAQTRLLGSLSGRLTDLHSAPISGAIVILRNQATGEESRALTARNGSYRFSALSPGSYRLRAVSGALGSSELDGVAISPGFEAHVVAAVEFRPARIAVPAMTEVAVADAAGSLKSVSSPANLSGTIEPTAAKVAGYLAEEQLAKMSLEGRKTPFTPAKAATAASAPAAAELARELVPAVPPAVVAIDVTAEQTEPARQIEPAGPVAPAQAATELSVATDASDAERLPTRPRNWAEFALERPTPEEEPSGRRNPDELAANREAPDASAFRNRGSAQPSATAAQAPADHAAEDAGTLFHPAEPDISPVSRSPATGNLHGQLSLFGREGFGSAQNSSAQVVKESTLPAHGTVPVFTATPFSPADKWAKMSAGLGGQFLHSRLSWFAGLQTVQRSFPALATVRHPDKFFAQPGNDEMQVLSARLGLSAIDPVNEGLAAYSGALESLGGLLGPTDRTSQTWSGSGRLDFHGGERHQFTLEGGGGQSSSPGGGVTRTSEFYGMRSFGSPQSTSSWGSARWLAFVTPNLLTTTIAEFRLDDIRPGSQKPSNFEQGLMANLWNQLPQITVDSRYGMTIGNPARFGAGSSPRERKIGAGESLDWVHGRLLLKAGFDLQHSLNSTSLLRNHTGTYVYSRVENFASDLLAYSKFGMGDAQNPQHQHNCDQRGRAWRDSLGQLHGLGYLPCYSYYTQTLGPTEWHLSTNDLAGWTTAQWQPAKNLVLSAALRWEMQQVPQPMALVNNPDLPLTQHMPSMGSQWGPRISAAWGVRESHWPILKLGLGTYYARTSNSVLESALTQTGSPNGDLRYFFRPADMLSGMVAPPFPYVYGGKPDTSVKPAALEFAPRFRNPEVHQGEVALEQSLPGHVRLTVSAMASLARRLPITFDSNYDPASNPGTITYNVVDPEKKGPIRTSQITVPFFAAWPAKAARGRLLPQYQQISQLVSRANSTYEAAQVSLSRSGRRGIALRAQYTYGQAWDWNPNESSAVMGSSLFDPTNFALENGRSDLDVRHSASGWLAWDSPWKSHSSSSWWRNGWRAAIVGQYRTGAPYTMRTAHALPQFSISSGAVVQGLGPGMNGYGGDNRVYGVGRNTFRYPSAWKTDLRASRRFSLGHERELELMAETFNMFNHRNVTRIETIGYYFAPGSSAGGLPTLNFMDGSQSGRIAFGQPLDVNSSDFYRERQIDFGLRVRFLVAPALDY